MRQLRKPSNASGQRPPLADSQSNSQPPRRVVRKQRQRRMWLVAAAAIGLLAAGMSSASWSNAGGSQAVQAATVGRTSSKPATAHGIKLKLLHQQLDQNEQARMQTQAEFARTVQYVAAVKQAQAAQWFAAVAHAQAEQRWYAGVAKAQAAQQAKQRAANKYSGATNSTSSNVSSGWSPWDGVAKCETGSNWHHQTAYDGGLGILHAAWVEFGGTQFAQYGSQATREQQIIVANRIKARYGLSGWGCKAYYGK